MSHASSTFQTLDVQPLKGHQQCSEGKGPSGRGMGFAGFYKDLQVSWQSEEVAEAPGVRVPGPPEKKQV